MRTKLRPPVFPPIESPTPFEGASERGETSGPLEEDHASIPPEYQAKDRRSEEPRPAEAEAPTRWGGESGESVIDRDSTVEGKVYSKKNLRVEGRVEGEVKCEGTLVVADGAVVQARVEAENVTVSGTIEGEVICRGHLHVLAAGRIEGSATALKIAIDSGASYEGELHMMEPPARDEAEGTLLGGPLDGADPDRGESDAGV